MAHPLEKKIDEVRRHARRLLTFYALSWTVAIALAAVILLALADYWIRFQDPGIRVMSSLAVVGVLAWCGYRFWITGIPRLGDVQLAKRIESRFPALADRLASSLEFLKQSEVDPQAGSAALRRAVIIQTEADVARVNLREVFEPTATHRAVTIAAGIGLIAATLAIAAPESAQIALKRLAMPWGDDVWPRFYRVEFRSAPNRLAVGQTFEVELLSDEQHRVPPNARIQYRYETTTGGVEEESEAMSTIGGTVVARKENVSRPFWYRAEGGDDRSMVWRRLEVVEPPRVESLEITLHPPAYSGLPVETSEKSIHALRGTKIALAGTSSKKLRKASLKQESGGAWPAAIAADGYGFSLSEDATEPLVIDKSGPYWLELEDVEGLSGGTSERWDMHAISDQPPTVTIEQPSGNVMVTPRGEVAVKIATKDDLAIRDVALHYSRSDRTDVEDFAVPLYTGPPAVPPRERGALSTGELGESRTTEHHWRLAELDLKPGVQLTFWATAGDYLPQTGKSPGRKLSVITEQEFEERLAQRQTLVFNELQRVLKLQQEARAQTRSLDIQLEQVKRLNKQDIDHAQSAELNQRQVKRTLTSNTEGIPAQIADFLADLDSNRVDSPDIQRNMAAILQELERLGSENLNPIERDLTGVIKAAQSQLPKTADEPPPAKAEPSVSEPLASVGRNQDQVIASLEQMLSKLGQWDNYRRFAREINQLQRDQDQIASATKELSPKTLGRELKDLEPQQQADLKKLSSQQIELSRRLEKVQQQMAEMNQALQQTDPLSAGTIADGLHQAQRQAISGQMRQSSEQLEKNQLGQAAQQQTKIAKDLDDLLGILSNRREQELSRLVKQLRETEAELAQLRKKQMGLKKQMRAAAEQEKSPEQKKQLERLAREQKKLAEEAARLARKLERLQAEQAGRSAGGAAGKMARSGEAGQQGDAQAAGDQAEQAEQDLEDAERQLAERRRQAEEDLAREQLARLEDSLKSLHERQTKLIEETQRLENLRAMAGRFTRAQMSSVNDLARQQKSLEGETSLLAEKLSLAEVITLALTGASKHMSKAADLLEHRETGSPTQGAQLAAQVRFAQLLAAFEKKPAGKQPGKEGGGEGGGEGGQSRSDGNYVLAQLKLLKLLQEDLNGRYRTLTTTPEDNVEQQLTEIAAEQGKLAELALKLAQPPDAKKPEDDPDSLPDVRKNGNDVPPPAELPELPAEEPQ